MTIGERIKAFAVAKYGKLGVFGDAVGMNPQTLSLYANDKRKPGTEILVKFHAAGMSIDWLLTGKGPMDAKEAEEQGVDVEIIGGFPRELVMRMIQVAEEMKEYTPQKEDNDEQKEE